MRVLFYVAFVIAAMTGCKGGEANPKKPISKAVEAGAFMKAVNLAKISTADLVLITAESVTPNRPIDSSLSLNSADPIMWDAADTSTGSIALGPNSNGNPGIGSRAGLTFKTTSGLRYLALCQQEVPGGVVRFLFGGATTGSGSFAMVTNEFAAVSDQVTADGTGTFLFHQEQGGHKILGCRLFGFKS